MPQSEVRSHICRMDVLRVGLAESGIGPKLMRGRGYSLSQASKLA
jgi:hypothetical protein